MSDTRSGSADRLSLSSRRVIALVCAFCLLLTACGSDATDSQAEAGDGLAPASASQVDDPAVDEGAATQVEAAGDDASSTETSTADAAESEENEPGLDAETLGDRGRRLDGEENPESLLPDPTATPIPTTPPIATVGPAPTATPEPEPVSVEPTPTPAPTPTPPPLNDPIGQPPAQLPTEPVPSDDLVIQGPPTDDGSEVTPFSDAGVLACATTEAAIEFLDRGDLTRTEEALQSAGALAGGASEPAISALAAQLSAAGRDGDAAFDAIVAMLSACAQYGYEV